MLDFGFVDVAPPARPAVVLGAGRVLEVRRLNLADGVPWARVTVWCLEALAAHLSLADVERTTFHELLDVGPRRRHPDHRRRGGDRRRRARARRTGRLAGAGVRAGDPVGRRRRLVLLAEHVFPGHLTQFVVELTSVDRSVAPSGLRSSVAPRQDRPRPRWNSRVGGGHDAVGAGGRGGGVAGGACVAPGGGGTRRPPTAVVFADGPVDDVERQLRPPQHHQPGRLRPDLLRPLRLHRRPRRRHRRPRDRGRPSRAP